MQQDYELMILYKPLLLDDIKKNTVSKIEKIVKKLKAQISEVDSLGKRMLAYPIKGFEEGHYIEYKLIIETDKVEELKKELSFLDNVLRYLIIKK